MVVTIEFGRAVAMRWLAAALLSVISASFAASQSTADRGIDVGTFSGIRAGGSDADHDPAGGAAFADFDSLMQLIQTTVAPDSWEALGGNSTMSPYPQGIWVDPEGVVREVQVEDSVRGGNEPSTVQTQLASLRASLSAAENHSRDAAATERFNWRSASTSRCVSLRRLSEAAMWRLDRGQTVAPEMLYTAGLSSIDRVVLLADDVWLVGPVGGIVSAAGGMIDRRTGGSPIELSSWVQASGCVAEDRPIGCTIDPTPDGLAAAAAVGRQLAEGRIAFGEMQTAVAGALGRQRVGVMGIRPDSVTAYLMIAVDRHMKQLALGQHALPDGVPNYFDAIQTHIAGGVPSELLLRLWLTAKPIHVRSDRQRTLFELSGRPIRLSGENQIAEPDGSRGEVRRDVASEFFVESFNDNWSSIRQMYPAYGRVESLYTAAAVCELADRFGRSTHQELIRQIAVLRPHENVVLSTPRSVDSIAASATIRHGRQRHRVVVASGGVWLKTGELVPDQVEVYPSLADQIPGRTMPRATPIRPEVWWWDL